MTTPYQVKMTSEEDRPRKRLRPNGVEDFDEDYKVFNDPIHGHIELNPLCIKIIDTPEFQRLRYIKQLGACYYVYPGATNNRFEHSIGVCHLAGEMVSRFKTNQPELGITDVEVLCVKIAGLCHDLGHGPFSHMFDGGFIPRVEPGSKWKHEKGSIDMLDHLIDKNNLEEEFKKYGILENDLLFIKELIHGPLDGGDNVKGRPDKPYLYEIVANKRNSVDVDKWDYFARDCHMLGIKNNFDHLRCMRFMRVIKNEDDKLQICLRDKEVGNIYDMFYTRCALHRRAYQHAVSHAIEAMIVDVLVIANDFIKLPGKNGKLYNIQNCKDDMEAYSKLTDGIIQQIALEPDSDLEPARVLIDRIHKRQLYRCIGDTPPPKSLDKAGEKKLLQEIVDCDKNRKLTTDCLLLKNVSFNYSMKNKNPVDNVRFFSKSKPNETKQLRKDQVSQFLPEKFEEHSLRIFCKDHDVEVIESARSAFVDWCQNHGYEPRTDRWELTPSKSKDISGTPIADRQNDTVCSTEKRKVKNNLFPGK